MSLLNRKPSVRSEASSFNRRYGMPGAYDRVQQNHSRSPFRRRGFVTVASFTAIIFIVAIVVLVVSLFTGNPFKVSSLDNCLVTDKGSVMVEDGHEYRIYTENCDVLTVSDSIVDGQFASASTYSKITVGKEYDFKVRGVRFPLFSQFPNILEATPAS
jgi:hypothetical protein